MDDQILRWIEEGQGPHGCSRPRRPQDEVHQLGTDTNAEASAYLNLLPLLSHLLSDEAALSQFNIDDTMTIDILTKLIIRLLNHIPEEARRHILADPSLVPFLPSEIKLARHPQENNWGMWRSFLVTVVFSAISNMMLYFLSDGKRRVEQNMEASRIRRGTDKGSWSEWIVKLLLWMVERVIAPVILTSLVVLVGVSVIDKEKHLLKYERNGTANVIVNSLSRGFFLGIRDFPGLRDADAWACIAAFLIDLLGASFLLPSVHGWALGSRYS